MTSTEKPHLQGTNVISFAGERKKIEKLGEVFSELIGQIIVIINDSGWSHKVTMKLDENSIYLLIPEQGMKDTMRELLEKRLYKEYPDNSNYSGKRYNLEEIDNVLIISPV